MHFPTHQLQIILFALKAVKTFQTQNNFFPFITNFCVVENLKSLVELVVVHAIDSFDVERAFQVSINVSDTLSSVVRRELNLITYPSVKTFEPSRWQTIRKV